MSRRLSSAVLTAAAWGGLLAGGAAHASAQTPSLAELSLDDLMRLDVVTASRTEEKLPRATSVMSVITAAEIERAGYRTLDDVLARVPGFFVTTQATWRVIGSRGLVADGNDHILLLVDGHRQNSIVAHGFQQQDQLPALEKVARIEIVRGPGSVLWGGSAAHAVVNIVTRDDVPARKTAAVSAGYASGDGLRTLNVLKDLRMGDATGLLSASVWQADGYDAPSGPNVEFPWGAPTNVWPRLDAQSPGFELYLKLKDPGGAQILGRLAETSVPYPWDSWSYAPAGGVRPGSELRMRKAYLDYQNVQRAGDRLRIDYSLYGDLLLQNRFPDGSTTTAGVPVDSRWIEDQSREELAIGAEITATSRFSDSHVLRYGASVVHTNAGPNRGFRFDTETNLPTVPSGAEEQVPVIDIPSGRDNTVALYAEDRISLFGGRTDLFAGVRADHDDWRERRTVVLPRAGIVHSLTDRLTAKYVFNTGYLRPNAAYSKSGGKFYRAPSKTIETVNVVDRSERVRSHDVQLSLTAGRHYLVGTVFQMSIDNFISWETKLDLGYRDMGAAATHGVEVEGRYFFTDRISTSANYSLARGTLRTIPTGVDVNGQSVLLDGALTTPDRRWLNYPAHTWNLGADIALDARQSVNVNLRGWNTMPIVEPFTAAAPGAFGELGGERYLDVTYFGRRVAAGVDLRVSGANLLGNQDSIGMVVNNGVYHPRGRSLAIQISRAF